MAQEAQEAPFCRICWAEEPPRGLADVLLDQPCGCRGYMARVHLSCLHAWQLQQLSAQPLADTATCGVCRQPYNVPDQLWEALVAAGGIDGDERRRVRQQQLLQQRNPWLLRLLELQRQAAQLRQDLRQAGQQLPTDRLRLAMQQRLQALGQARRTAGLLHVVLPREPEQMAQLQRLRQELKQLQQDYRTFLGADRVGQHTLELAKVLHEVRLGGSWLLATLKMGVWLFHALSTFFDSSWLPAAEPPRPPLWRRLLPDVCITAWVLGNLAHSERQRLGSWRAVWQCGYSAQYLKRTALFGALALIAAVAGRADPGHAAPGAPSHQPMLAANADWFFPLPLFLTSMSLSYWPSLLDLVCWPPRAWLASFCSLLRSLPSPPSSAPNWPVLPAAVGWRLNELAVKQSDEEREWVAVANLCLTLLQQLPQAMRRFVEMFAPSSPS